MTEPGDDERRRAERRLLAIIIATIVVLGVVAFIVMSYASARLCYENMGYGLEGCPN